MPSWLFSNTIAAEYETLSVFALFNTCNGIACICCTIVLQINSIGLNSGAWVSNHNIMIANPSHNQSLRTLFSFPTWFGALLSTNMLPWSKNFIMIVVSMSFANSSAVFVPSWILNHIGLVFWLIPQNPVIAYIFQKSGLVVMLGISSDSGLCWTSQLKRSASFKLFSSPNFTNTGQRVERTLTYSTAFWRFWGRNLSTGSKFGFLKKPWLEKNLGKTKKLCLYLHRFQQSRKATGCNLKGYDWAPGNTVVKEQIGQNGPLYWLLDHRGSLSLCEFH